MIVKGIELKPGMVLIDDNNNGFVVIPHKRNGIAFVSYNNCCSWSTNLDMVLCGELKEIRDIPRGDNLTDGKLLWRKTKYRINDGVELDEEQFLREIITYSGRNVKVSVI